MNFNQNVKYRVSTCVIDFVFVVCSFEWNAIFRICTCIWWRCFISFDHQLGHYKGQSLSW